ncbi:hypothetical protein Nepgr_020121 [Nepenthes gracilis]|uniref:DNA-directed RNA polymerase III subunit RPC4 n=1 Tax=Nepenthes gracilis TaxID=150966 RepID=A0AAD3SWA9_NEPGR|nr:hypothetical protein Nepgr_020121 [Nepenthes gracilis]
MNLTVNFIILLTVTNSLPIFDAIPTSVQVAFGPGALAQDASASSRTYRIPRDEKSRDSRRMELIGSNSDGTQHSISSSLAAEFDRIDDRSMDVSKTSDAKIKEKYREPWDYEHTYYPITLPLRKPGSGNPELLDEAEFGEAARDMECDEDTVNAASELGLLDSEEGENMRLLFFQLPDTLPLVKRSSRSKGKEIEGISSSPGLKGSTTSSKDDNALEREMSSGMAGSSWRCCTLEELYGGHVGKMLVYKSGAVKLKLGEILFDVSPGSDCTFAQDVVAINPKDHHFCAIGQLEKRAIVTPDVNFLLDGNFGSSQTMRNAH